MRWLTGEDRRKWEEAIADHARHVAIAKAFEERFKVLETSLERFRADWVYERERADRAVDSLLFSKGLPQVMPSTPSQQDLETDPFVEDPDEVQKILVSMGLGPKKATDA